jgi:hypothetical protein
MPTPLLEEILIMLNSAIGSFDMEADDSHPDPMGDAIELIREAEEALTDYLKTST